jgi:5-methylthioadenosine/S-adenosylhomocysteine deaminase
MSPKESADLLIEPRWVLPILPVNTVLAEHAVAVRGGRIAAVGPTQQMTARFAAREHIQRPDHALLPGFVNAHARAAAALFRGLPRAAAASAAQRFAGPDLIKDAAQIAVAEMLRAGITCFAAADLFPEETARAAASAHVRAAIGLPVGDEPDEWAESSVAHLAKAEQLWDVYRSDPLVSLYFALPTPSAVSDATLTRVRRVADELDARVAMPVHESAARVHDSLAWDGRRPLQRLQALGLLRPGFGALHMAQLDGPDLELVQRTGICVVACPESDLRQGGGSCPTARLDASAVAVGLGTDGPIDGGALDILAEARTAALLGAKGDSAAVGLPGTEAASASPLSAMTVLRMATLGGAIALGMSAVIGSIESGKSADLVCIDLGGLEFRTSVQPAEAIVFGATRAQVSDVWTSGRTAVGNGCLLALDEREMRALGQRWAERIRTEILA